jgi:hypothetical protein
MTLKQTFFNVLLTTDFQERLQYNIHNEAVVILLKLFEVSEKSIPLTMDRYESVKNQSHFPIILPFMKIDRKQFCQLISNVTEDLLDLLWNYFDHDFDDEMILYLFKCKNITHSTITWFKKHHIMPTTCDVLDNILMFYIIQNDVVKFFKDFKIELSSCEQPLFSLNRDAMHLPLSPQILQCLKNSDCVSNLFLSQF